MLWRSLLIFLLLLFLNVQAYESLFRLVKYPENIKLNERHSKSSVNSKRCTTELLLLKQALDNNEPWAVRMIDTWAKINAGYLSGNTIFIGDFDSCVRFEHQQKSGQVLQGQHCFVSLSALPNSTLDNERNDLSLKHVANFFRNNGITVLNSICMPNSCTEDEIVPFLNQNFLFQNDLIADGSLCRDINALEFGALQYFATIIFSIFAILMILSTTYEIVISKKSKNSQPNKLLASFSVYTNGSKLFDMTRIKSPNSIDCLHGIRAMSIYWIILGHRFSNQVPYGNPMDVIAFRQNNILIGSILLSHPIAVDTFFVMGAVLMTFATLKDCEKQQLHIARMIWRRYIRYTPILGALILFVVAFTDIIGQGPIYAEEISKLCVENWWYALLHIQNYIPHDEMCINWTWYLSVDFQLFVISPFIIWLIYKYGRMLLVVPAFLCLATIIYIIAISIIYNIKVISGLEYTKYIYFVTHSRAGPWFIGIILGYFLYSKRGQTFKVSKVFNAILWISTISLLSAIILLEFAITNAEGPISQAYFISFLALQRNLWAVGICCIIFACQHLKTGGIVRWFLSLPQWQPISRMGLSMYLIGAYYQIMMIFNQRVPLYMNFWSAFPILMSDIVIITMISIWTYLAFEAPVLIIEDYIYKKIKGKAT